MSLTNKGPKNNSNKKGVSAALLDQKRKEALERQAAADQRTPVQQLARLDAGGFAAEKERTKLGKLIMKGKK